MHLDDAPVEISDVVVKDGKRDLTFIPSILTIAHYFTRFQLYESPINHWDFYANDDQGMDLRSTESLLVSMSLSMKHKYMLRFPSTVFGNMVFLLGLSESFFWVGIECHQGSSYVPWTSSNSVEETQKNHNDN